MTVPVHGLSAPPEISKTHRYCAVHPAHRCSAAASRESGAAPLNSEGQFLSQRIAAAVPPAPSPGPLPAAGHGDTGHSLSIADRLQQLESTLQPLSQEARYHKIMALGKGLPAYPKQHMVPAHKVKGCQSTVYLRVFEAADGKLHFEGASDALISSGRTGPDGHLHPTAPDMHPTAPNDHSAARGMHLITLDVHLACT